MRDGLTSLVLQFVEHKDEVTAAEIAAFVIKLARKDLQITDADYEHSAIGKTVLWRGATSIAKDTIKRPRLLDRILDSENELEDEDENEGDASPEEATERQADLFSGLGAFVRVERRHGSWTYKRRRVLTQEEYLASLALLQHSHTLIGAKVERYQADYKKALPHWKSGLTFGEAFTLATEAEAK